MLAFLVELAILILVMLCVGQEQRPWVFLGGVILIVTPWWIVLGLGVLFAVAVVARWLHRAYRRKSFADAALSRQLTVAEWRSL
jgi:hypothetical protein